MLIEQRQLLQTEPSQRYEPIHAGAPSRFYPVPTQHGYMREECQEIGGLTFAQHEFLRSRKTPHGMIHEQCEPQSDQNVDIPASKHVLLLTPPRSLNSKTMMCDGQPSNSSSIRRTQDSLDNIARMQNMTLQPALHAGYSTWTVVGGVDSAPNQSITVDDRGISYYSRSHIPTNLPTIQHARLGPTTSSSQRLYGPYWPDGTFSPYHPAPIRDSGYFRGQPELSPPFAPLRKTRPLRRAGKFPSAGSNDFTIPDLIAPRYEPDPRYLTFHDRLLSAKASAGLPQWGQPSHVFENSQSWHVYGNNGDVSQQRKSMESDDTSERIAYRHRAFWWAYRVYDRLLVKMHHEQKSGKPNSAGSSLPNLPIDSVFLSTLPRQRGVNSRDLPPLHRGFSFSQKSEASSSTLHADRNQNPGSLHNHIPQVSMVTTYPPAEPNTFDQWPNQYQSTLSAATSALETIELLCEEADAPWTDGMLLAGCLAYHLGLYPKALVWYQRILAHTARHVEAISNLAATLLVLGRRDEAREHWALAVQLRPAYFEAVEHLLRLLLDDDRSRDAIKMIEYVESQLKLPHPGDEVHDRNRKTHNRSSSTSTLSSAHAAAGYDARRSLSINAAYSDHPAAGFGSSGYAIPGSDNGRLLALLHAKGNIIYGLGEEKAAAAIFEDTILIATGYRYGSVGDLTRCVLSSCVAPSDECLSPTADQESNEPILLSPQAAGQTLHRMYPSTGELPGLEFIPRGLPYKAAIATSSNTLLTLAKIYQDGSAGKRSGDRIKGTRDILALYYLSWSLQRSPSTANNVGILLASVPQTPGGKDDPSKRRSASSHHPWVEEGNEITLAVRTYLYGLLNNEPHMCNISPDSGIALALQYYQHGLSIDPKHAHLWTNLGSLLKDLGQLAPAISLYKTAVQCDSNFGIALANLANAVKDQGRIADAITYYRRAVQSKPDLAEAVCGLATALNSVCNWYGRGGVYEDYGTRDLVHVDNLGRILEARNGFGWIHEVVQLVDKQLTDGQSWGVGTLTPSSLDLLCQQIMGCKPDLPSVAQQQFYQYLHASLENWGGNQWEGARIVRLVERATRQIGWLWYQDKYVAGREYFNERYSRPRLPSSLPPAPQAPTVLPFHTFTTPLSAKQVRQISQRNALRISVSALRSSWLPAHVYPPPCPPAPCLNVGYVSSDFNNHPLAHLMQSIFGLHDPTRVRAFCYATTSSDGSIHREQIEREAPVFHDTSMWSTQQLVECIVSDGIHVLVNLNGYTRGAKNEVFAARPAPIQMSFMGFAGTLGAEWCDYVFADPISILPKTLSPWRNNVGIEDCLCTDALAEDLEHWMYAENVIFAQSSFFCVDHKQSAPDAANALPLGLDQISRDAAWVNEQDRRWRLRKETFPTLSDSAIILGNFNQLYKIDPSTFRLYLRILAAVPMAVLWLLRFPDLGEQNLRSFAREWAGEEVASRLFFTDVAAKGAHITRASIVDLFLDTPECNAHTTAADVIWSGTPIVTWARWEYKMCSRMASSIVNSALPEGSHGDEARKELLVESAEQYEERAIALASELRYGIEEEFVGRGKGRLMDLRRMLWEGRWTSRLFDTKRWVKDVERAYWAAWKKWEAGEGGDIWL